MRPIWKGAEATVRARELEMARSLVESLADRFKPESYTDEYRRALEQLIERKMKGETRNAKRRKPAPTVIDLMEALQASVEQARGAAKGRRNGRAADAAEGKRRTRKRSAA